MCAERVSTIVIDNGTAVTKAGYAGHYWPRSVFPTIIGRRRSLGRMEGMEVKLLYVGDEAQRKRASLACRHPIQRGIVTNWDDMEMVSVRLHRLASTHWAVSV